MATQTWDNLKILMYMEYAKAHCQDGISARATGYASAHNVMEEYAAAKEELVENFMSYWLPPSTMDAVLATIVDGRRAILLKTQMSIEKIISPLF